ncbi:MAG: hypothetical protein ACYS0H_28355 [Planctomycetota bacterium]|jgi:hypothetical protein
MKHQIFERTQHSRGSSAHQFGGPDRYVAVVSRPDDMEPWPERRPLNRKHLERLGYTFTYCGEGYAKNQGPRSMLGQARDLARLIGGEGNNA